MRKTMIALLTAGILLSVGGMAGKVLTSDWLYPANQNETLPYMIPGGMYGNYGGYLNSGKEKADIEELEDLVHIYLEQYEEHLEIGDIFIYEDSDYYFSIYESETGMGAMELLVNPYSGSIRPEFGPNMMWNLKYGMHSGSGMMGRGMMNRGSNDYSYSWNTDSFRNTISREDAVALASGYVERNTEEGYYVADEGHEFYGYYTFHIEYSGGTAGMLSVNGFSGDIWYHDWHGTILDVIENHNEEDSH